MEYDFLIVGLGITGSILAIELEARKKKFKIINLNSDHTSSKVAAGIMHPLALKRGSIAWRGKEFFEFSNQFYKNLELKNNTNFYKNYTLRRVFSSFEEQNNWIGKSSDYNYKDLIDYDSKDVEFKNSFGTGILKKASRLKVNSFLDFFQNKYGQNFINKKFNPEKLEIKNELFYFENNPYKKIVLCQGVNAMENLLFNYLPIIPNKGELLEVKSSYLPNYILNTGVFSLPKENNLFTIGSTYNHLDKEPQVTLKAREELLNKLSKIIDVKYLDLQNQKYGFRPTTLDRKPLIGEHPIVKNLYVINGMGSKAVLMAPLLINDFLDAIFNNRNINSSVDIKRYVRKLKKENLSFANSILRK